MTYSSELELLVFTSDSKVMAISPEDWTLQWSQTLTEPARGPAMAVEHSLFIPSIGAKLFKLDGSRKGKLDWETDLEKPAMGSMAYLPIMDRLSLIDSAGALQVVDLKTGKSLWRYGLEVSRSAPFLEPWSARLKGQNIEEFKMDWLHKGWTVWSPCGDRRICLFTPNKGQLMQRIQLSHTPLSLPLALNKRLLFLGASKAGKLSVMHLVEEAEVKRLKPEAARQEQKQVQ